jgi:hypothetical protein
MTIADGVTSSIAAEFGDGRFTIETDEPDVKVAWRVSGRPRTPGGGNYARESMLSLSSTLRGHKTDTSETTRATSRDASPPPATSQFAGESVSRMIARVRA